MGAAFVKALPAMKRMLAEYAGPFIAKVYRDGSVRPHELFGQKR